MGPRSTRTATTGQAEPLDHATLMAALQRMPALGHAAFAKAFPALVALIEQDFQREEALMDALRYAATAPHCAQHARVRAGLHRAQAALQAGQPALARRCTELLPKWLELHHATHDVPLAAIATLRPASGDHTIK